MFGRAHYSSPACTCRKFDCCAHAAETQKSMGWSVGACRAAEIRLD